MNDQRSAGTAFYVALGALEADVATVRDLNADIAANLVEMVEQFSHLANALVAQIRKLEGELEQAYADLSLAA